MTAFGIFALSIPAMAATVTLGPSAISVTKGQSFSVSISIDPAGAGNYADKVELDYPSDLVQATSFSLGNNWMALTQSGYDTIDNAGGSIVKTAGYPSGITGNTNFGTVTFKAIKSGSGSIKIGSNAVAFGAKDQSALTGNESSLKITAPIVKASDALQPSAGVETASPSESADLSTSSIAAETSVVAAPQNSPVYQQSAAASDSVPSKGNSSLWIIAIVILVGIIGYGLYALSKKNSGN